MWWKIRKNFHEYFLCKLGWHTMWNVTFFWDRSKMTFWEAYDKKQLRVKDLCHYCGKERKKNVR